MMIRQMIAISFVIMLSGTPPLSAFRSEEYEQKLKQFNAFDKAETEKWNEIEKAYQQKREQIRESSQVQSQSLYEELMKVTQARQAAQTAAEQTVFLETENTLRDEIVAHYVKTAASLQELSEQQDALAQKFYALLHSKAVELFGKGQE